MVKTLQLMKSLCVAAVLLLGSVSAWAETTTLLEYGTADVPWSSDGLATWTAGGSPALADGIVTISGGNGSYSTSKTISPKSGSIINLKAVWRGSSSTGRAFSAGNGSYFRFGNIYVAQNDQDKKHGYGFNGLDNIKTATTTFEAGSYRVDITQSTWLLIEAEINTATNTMTSFTIKSEDGNTTYVSRTNVALTSPDYTTVAFGYRKDGGVSTTNTEQLESILITETTSSTSYANYTVHFVDGNGAKVKEDEVRKGEVGKTVNANNNDKENYYANNFKYVYNNDGNGVEVNANGTAELTIVYTKYGKYTYTINAVDNYNNQLAELASETVYEGETKDLIWSKYIQVDGKWYVTSDNSFLFTATEAGSKNIVYQASDISYFFEMENLTRSGGAYLTEKNNSYSGNSRLRLSKGSTYYTPALAAGVYRLIINCENSNASASEVYVYTRSQGGTLSDKLYTHSAPNGYSAIDTYIEVPEGYSIAFNGNEGGSANNNCRMDYVILKFDEVATAILDCKQNETSNEFATFIDAGEYNSAAEVYAAHTDWQINQATSVDGKKNITKVIRNAAIKDGTDWNGIRTITLDQQYTGAPENCFIDANSQVLNTNQTVYGVPAGTYIVRAATRADEGVYGHLYIYDGTSDIATKVINDNGSEDGELGNGWGWSEMMITLTEPKNLLIGFYTDASNGWAGCDTWEMYEVEPISVTLGANGYATFASEYALDLTSIKGAIAYSAKVDGNNIDFHTLSMQVVANTGILLGGEPNASVNIPVIANGMDVKENDLLAGSTFTNEAGYTYYGMKKAANAEDEIVFARFDPSSVAIPANKAYLKVANTEASRLTVSFNGETTGISTVEAVKAEAEGIYNLNGQRIAAPAKGLYIVNGKKVVLN